MELNQRITAFSKLGEFLDQFKNKDTSKNDALELNTVFYDVFKDTLIKSTQLNAWFTANHLEKAIEAWSDSLKTENLEAWLKPYTFPANDVSKRVAIIMAGNLPLVGFHDFLSVLITGHKAVVKLSSNDQILLPLIAKVLIAIAPKFEDYITFTTERLPEFDAVIATGSNNTARYFEYYFKNKPHIIRKNRNAVAVLKGNETIDELESLSEDIFRYFGMGCRSISKIFVPEGYNFDNFYNGMFSKKDFIDHHKYANNYDYNKAVYLMSLFPVLDNGFLILKEDKTYSSPIAVVFYEYYTNEEELKIKLEADSDQIQCIVSKDFIDSEIDFGNSQQPKLDDYADGIDTVAFLLKI
ncbi:acyl-CoA reductase [Leeuwenhoekiella sp. A16]|uniref:acyl-CoA reductase n=1 Tax=unclassified Leeuwenhoekiella TaxID=2615029 RepID=UPI003A7FB85C